jgi:prepilin-type N-terminal cleavage/methylation domain-containing protein
MYFPLQRRMKRFASTGNSFLGVTRGFTLIELMLVMGIMASAFVMTLPSIGGIGSAGKLDADGNRVLGMVNAARQNSLAKNAMTALILVSDPSFDTQYRLLTMLELTPPLDSSVTPTTSDWKQITKWETLSPGIIIDNWTTTATSTVTVFPAIPNLNFGGQVIGQFKAIIFMPDGSTFADSPTTLRLVKGLQGKGQSDPVITGSLKNGVAANYYQMTVLNATGRIKIERP